MSIRAWLSGHPCVDLIQPEIFNLKGKGYRNIGNDDESKKEVDLEQFIIKAFSIAANEFGVIEKPEELNVEDKDKSIYYRI
jgi:hypothetical protein